MGGMCLGQDVSKCDGALVKATYQRQTSEHLDYRLASFVTKEIYDELKHGAGAHAVIYGIPMGATYDDFHKRVEQMMEQSSTSLTHDQASNVMWTALDPNSVTAYSKCIDGLTSGDGLFMAAQFATKTDIAVLLRYVPVGKGKGEISLEWSGLAVDKDNHPLPTTMFPGRKTVIVSRPTEQTALAVNSPGFGPAIILEPLPPPPPPNDSRIFGRWKGTATYRDASINPRSSEIALDISSQGEGTPPVVKVLSSGSTDPTWMVSYIGHVLTFLQGNPNKCENRVVLSLNETGALSGQSSQADDTQVIDRDCLTKTYNQPDNIDYTFHKN